MVEIKKPKFPFLKAAKSGSRWNRNSNSSGYYSVTLKTKRKTDDFEFETVQRKIRSTKEVKTGTNTNPAVSKGVKNP